MQPPALSFQREQPVRYEKVISEFKSVVRKNVFAGEVKMDTLMKICVLFLVVSVHQVVARPPSRVKRVSDSHLADLETKIALNRLKGMAITMPVAAGRIDVAKIGRKRRSESRFLDVLFNQSEEDNSEPIQDYQDFGYSYNRLNLQ